MATLPVATAVTSVGLDVTAPATAAALSQTFANNPGTFIVVKNGGGATIVATIVTPQTVSDGSASPLSVADRTVSIAAGKTFLIGPFPSAQYNDGNNEITVNFDIITSVLLQVLRVNTLVA